MLPQCSKRLNCSREQADELVALIPKAVRDRPSELSVADAECLKRQIDNVGAGRAQICSSDAVALRIIPVPGPGHIDGLEQSPGLDPRATGESLAGRLPARGDTAGVVENRVVQIEEECR